MYKDFFYLFESYEHAHAIYKISGYDENGKKIGRGDIVREPFNPVFWQKHLDGDENLAGIPLLSDNTCKWAAIDIDDMKGYNHKQIIDKIKRMELPLICFRSSSGAAHLFLFCSERVDAQLIRARLIDWSSRLGFSGSEIFPKQTYRMKKDDFCNHLSLPYYKGNDSDRYAFDYEGNKLSPSQFLSFVQDKRIKESDIVFTPESEKEAEFFSDGPICLQHLEKIEGGFSEGGRNNALMNAAIYLKKKYPDTWKNFVGDYNSALCSPALPFDEVAAIIKSLEKKDYFYMCKELPICSYCNKTLCRKQKYGIGTSNSAEVFDIDNITKLEGDPVRWIIEIEGQRMELSTKALINQTLFKEACVDALNKYPKHMVRSNWEDFIQDKLDKLSPSDIIYAPEEASAKGQFYLLFDEYLSYKKAISKDEVYTGDPFWDDESGTVIFISRGLIKFLDGEKFKYSGVHEIWTMLREKGCENKPMRIKGKTMKVWIFPQPEVMKDVVESKLEFGNEDDPNEDNEGF